MRRWAIPALAVFGLASGAALFAGRLHAPTAGPPRAVVMSMSDYTFNGNNPTLTFRPGERVQFVVRNDEDSPVRHNFRIVGLNVPCERDLMPGETREITLTMPRSGEFAYTCCTHPGMGGKLVVEGR